jgi:hypothetical protein
MDAQPPVPVAAEYQVPGRRFVVAISKQIRSYVVREARAQLTDHPSVEPHGWPVPAISGQKRAYMREFSKGSANALTANTAEQSREQGQRARSAGSSSARAKSKKPSMSGPALITAS